MTQQHLNFMVAKVCPMYLNNNSSLFTKEEMEGFNILANKVNQAGQSGRASFFLRKALT